MSKPYKVADIIQSVLQRKDRTNWTETTSLMPQSNSGEFQVQNETTHSKYSPHGLCPI